MDAQPLIVVRDVEASSRWYQAVLGLESAHGGPEYERLVRPGGRADDGPLHNPNAVHRELWLHDPDGYVVVVASMPSA